MLTTTNVPSDVKCIVLTAVGPGATAIRSFDVTPSQPATMSAKGMPSGSVTLTEAAYNAACSQVTAQTPLTWVSPAPVVVQLVSGKSTSIAIELRPAGDVNIATSFNDGTDGGTGNTPPTITTPASATPNPVLGTTATLSVLAADDNGESNLTYTWAATGTPVPAVSFSINGTNAAKTTTATFPAAGTYSLQVTVRDQGGLTTSSATTVTVTAKLTSIVVTPSSPTVLVSATQQFTATARDQFSATLSPQPTFTWTVSGGGTIASTGLFTAGTSTGGPYTVTATSSGISGTASVTISGTTTQYPVYQINCGSSSAVSPFSADTYSSGGTTHAVTNTISLTGVTNPAPAAVYQSERYGNTTYTIPGLVASAQYVVRLHFAELYWTQTGKRVFNVSINGSAVLSNFDIYATAQAQYKAVVREFAVTANTSGQIVIAFTTVTDNASIVGIEVLGFRTVTCTVGATQACDGHPGYDGKGICKAGTQTCVLSPDKTSTSWGTCSGSVGPGTRDCTSSADNDCNGTADNQETTYCQCTAGLIQTCKPAGACTSGTQTCSASADKSTTAWGTCTGATIPALMYRDNDADGFGDPTQSAQVCPGTAGYVSNGNDCDDTNGTIKPGYSVCSGNDRSYCDSASMKIEPCVDGCLSGQCRSDGNTVGKAGWVSCYAYGASTATRCLASAGCLGGVCQDGAPPYPYSYLMCDGPNDCPSGQTCCGYIDRGGSAVSRCQSTACSTDGAYIVCDPLASTCAGSTCTQNPTAKSVYFCI